MPTVCHDNVIQGLTYTEQKEICRRLDCPVELRCICTGQLTRNNSICCERLLNYLLIKRGIIKL